MLSHFREDTELSVGGAGSLDTILSAAMDILTITDGAGGDRCSVRSYMPQGEYLSGISFSDPVLRSMSYK